jgi:hypothetical protein
VLQEVAVDGLAMEKALLSLRPRPDPLERADVWLAEDEARAGQ